MMRRRVDAQQGYDLLDFDDDEGQRGRHRPAVLVGVGSAVVVTVAASMVAYTLSRPVDSEAVARAARAEVVTSLGHTVSGGDAAVSRALPTATAALDGTIGAPRGLAAGGRDVVPPRVLQAYRSAETRLATDSPGCKLPWWVLAGIGKVQSDHAAEGQVDENGTATVRIVGPRLDGTAVGTVTVRDTDKGTLDGDLTFDRGVGPMLLVPQTWAAIGRDGDGDGHTDVADADDAALSVGTLLCSAGGDLTTPEGLAQGLVRMDDSEGFPGSVLPWVAHYRSTGATAAGRTATSAPGTPSASAPAGGPAPEPGRRLPEAPDTPTDGPGFTTQPTTAPPSTTPPQVTPRPITPRPTTTPRPGTPAPKPAPAKPANPAPVKPAPAKPSPVKPTPARPTPVKPSPADPTPPKPAPAPPPPADNPPPSAPKPPPPPADPPPAKPQDPTPAEPPASSNGGGSTGESVSTPTGERTARGNGNGNGRGTSTPAGDSTGSAPAA